MYKQVLDPVGDSLFLSTLFAALPLVTLFVLLGGLKLKAHVAALWSLLVAILVAIIVYSMPVGQTLDAGAEGAAFGLFPIMWIVINAIWIYTLLERSGYFAVIKRSFGRLSDDQRVQAVLIAFCFGALLEALAGFGTPVAICSVMLIGLGFQPAKAAAVALVITPVAFGAMLCRHDPCAADQSARTTSAPWSAARRPSSLSSSAHPRRDGRRTPPRAPTSCRGALLRHRSVPKLSSMFDGVLPTPGDHRAAAVLAARRRRQRAAGGRRRWPVASGVERRRFEKEARLRSDAGPNGDLKRDTGRDHHAFSYDSDRRLRPGPDHWLPFFDWLDARHAELDWPGLHILNGRARPPRSSSGFSWANAPGTLLLICGLLSMITLRVNAAHAMPATLDQLILTVAAVLALAPRHGVGPDDRDRKLAGRRGRRLRPALRSSAGWACGHGSDTTSNALFGAQVSAAQKADLYPTAHGRRELERRRAGQMILGAFPAIGAAAVGMGGKEGDLFRMVVKWSLILLAAMVVIVYLQSTSVLSWMVVGS
jgi:lactate permease